MNKPYFKVFQSDADEQWYWHLVAANGQIVCQSEGYTTQQHANDATERFPEIVKETGDDKPEFKTGATLDQLDYMLDRHKHYARVHNDEEPGDGDDLELGIYIHQLVMNGQVEILEELRKKFYYDPNGTYLGALHQMGVAADVKAIHKTIDETIAELRGEDKEQEATDIA